MTNSQSQAHSFPDVFQQRLLLNLQAVCRFEVGLNLTLAQVQDLKEFLEREGIYTRYTDSTAPELNLAYEFCELAYMIKDRL